MSRKEVINLNILHKLESVGNAIGPWMNLIGLVVLLLTASRGLWKHRAVVKVLFRKEVMIPVSVGAGFLTWFFTSFLPNTVKEYHALNNAWEKHNAQVKACNLPKDVAPTRIHVKRRKSTTDDRLLKQLKANNRLARRAIKVMSRKRRTRKRRKKRTKGNTLLSMPGQGYGRGTFTGIVTDPGRSPIELPSSDLLK